MINCDKVKDTISLFCAPCDSREFNIHVCKELSTFERIRISADKIHKKCLKIPYFLGGHYVVVPLMHH